MKNKYLTLALLTASVYAAGQKSRDSIYKRQRIARTDIQVLFGYYRQNGNHSAITGGTGTEKLQVYSPEFTITHQPDSNHTFSLNAGVDVITSASMDNIDFIVSSASRVSGRLYINPGYSYRLKNTNTRIGVNSGISIESAYLSIPAGVSVDHTSRDGSREWSAALQCSFDDLRWGRLSTDYGHPVGLVYPWELRDTSWFSIYRRNSYNLDLAFYQVINARMQGALFLEAVYQKGLLSTPYHRVYFSNNRSTERVERLPGERWKFPLAGQLNIFAGDRTVIRSYYRFYRDNFGITAHTLQWEVPVKLSPWFSLAPLFRWYTQTAAKYFLPYRQHDLNDTWYTSDYDLSRFSSYKAGLRYAWYKRSDGLAAHILTLLLEIEHSRAHTPQQGFDHLSVNRWD